MIAHLTRFVVAAALVVGSYGFYIPGVQPEEFVKGADVVMKVNAPLRVQFVSTWRV